ncbi:segregation and condensation protein A [Tessaracoccus antarcticus]|uniref:Segregation and condensation protein A n=1 Tax=Tessaracoccus antarcticus TaxID=2479848 RepID=A0A3M0GBU5_9ACTN|nr:segregation/condensation protein A [Tessaracoccus antarcticus]RMB58993.1 segregation/condensation protein A [Tessaracoccus antarcticus]
MSTRKKKGADRAERTDQVAGFDVHLSNFEGPFDLLLQLIGRHEMDVTQVALSKVTDEFIAHVRAGGKEWDLDKTSSFLVVAATLLDLKCARLLPGGEVTDPEDLAALEARDLLFARLLQYRAFKRLASWIESHVDAASLTHWRPGGIEEQFRHVLPEVELGVSAADVARLAAAALTPKPVPHVDLAHLHGAQVSVVEQTALVASMLRDSGSSTFRGLTNGCDRLTVVVRFLAILELFRARQVAFEQAGPLTELHIRWVGGEETSLPDVDEYDTQPELEDA